MYIANLQAQYRTGYSNWKNISHFIEKSPTEKSGFGVRVPVTTSACSRPFTAC